MFAVAFGLDASALVLGGIAGLVAMLMLALVFAPVPLPRWRRDAVRDLLPYGGPAALAAVSWVGFRNGDYAIIGARLGAAQAGFYWRGFQLAVEYQTQDQLDDDPDGVPGAGPDRLGRTRCSRCGAAWCACSRSWSSRR